MRYWLAVLLILAAVPVMAQNVNTSSSQEERTMVRNITIEGFLVQNKNQLTKLFKPYRNHWLSKDDMDSILADIQKIYEEQGFQELVSITYKVDKHHLIFTVSMTS